MDVFFLPCRKYFRSHLEYFHKSPPFSSSGSEQSVVTIDLRPPSATAELRP